MGAGLSTTAEVKKRESPRVSGKAGTPQWDESEASPAGVVWEEFRDHSNKAGRQPGAASGMPLFLQQVQMKCSACTREEEEERQRNALPAVQRKCEHCAAEERRRRELLPHLDRIQASFGSHDVRGARAAVGGNAAAASGRMGALAYTAGDRVAFRSEPDLNLAAHEATHVVQQRNGAKLPGGVGRPGDAYEQQADAAAEAVGRGESAEPVLDRPVAQDPGDSTAAIQPRLAVNATRMYEPAMAGSVVTVAAHADTSASGGTASKTGGGAAA